MGKREREREREVNSGEVQAMAGQGPRGGQPPRPLPKRIILVRHGESQGNLDTSAYTTTPDYRIPLTPLGIRQAREAGRRIHDVLAASGAPNWKVYFYVSPYERTRATLRELGKAFSRRRVLGVREECRVREQDFGNFQVKERLRALRGTRARFGRFFFRFPEGESAADVFDRVASFMESLWRDIHMGRLNKEGCETNLVIVSHALTSRVFLMKWFKWTVEQFERLSNPGKCQIRVMQLGSGGSEYSLAIHHTDEELLRWGLSPDMIADQLFRVNAHQGARIDNRRWYLADFFGHLRDSDGDDEDDAEDSNTGDENGGLDGEQGHCPAKWCLNG